MMSDARTMAAAITSLGNLKVLIRIGFYIGRSLETGVVNVSDTDGAVVYAVSSRGFKTLHGA